MAAILRDAWAMWRRDRDLLVRLAAPFVLLPSLALRLLVPEPVAPAGTGLVDGLHLQGRYALDHGGALLAAAAITQFGIAALYAFYCDPAAGDLRAVLARAARRWPRFVLLAAMVRIATSVGLLLLVPGLILFGRVLPAGALLFGTRASAAACFGRAIRSTAGHTAAVTGLASLLVFGSLLAERPFALMDGWLRSLGAPNPVARAVVNGAGAGVDMLAAIAGVLIAVALYRRLGGAASGGGTSGGGTSGGAGTSSGI